MTNEAVLVLDAADPVGVACRDLPAGTAFAAGGTEITLRQAVRLGYKVALRPIARGETVRKYGAPIGSATLDIAPGEVVHTHNLESDYLPTHTLDAAREAAAEGRRSEP